MKMPRILMAGFDSDHADWLACHLSNTQVNCVPRIREVLEKLEHLEPSLLLLRGSFSDPEALQTLKELRARAGRKNYPVIYCAEESAVGEAARRLVRDLGVREVLLHPLDPWELARQAARVLGLPFVATDSATEKQVQDAITDVRNRSFSLILERINALERASTALLKRNLSSEMQDSARHDAHRLAGMMGTLGFVAGSRFAQEAEELLLEGVRLNESQRLRFSELVEAMRIEVSRGGAPECGLPENEKFRSLLVLDRDAELAEKLSTEAARRGFSVEAAKDQRVAREIISNRPPEVVLLNLVFSGKCEEGLAFLEELAQHTPPIPALVLTSRGTFTDRVEVARRGGHGFLPKSFSPGQILDAVLQILDRLHSADARIMAVDDDPQMLALLRCLLEPEDVCLSTLSDPLQFWETLEAFSPDLVVLDVDMPHLSGIELCRVVRNDFRWAETPIIFLTRHNDAQTIHRVFSAGADDFVAKPIVGPELLTRISNRLEKLRLRRSMAETDHLTGAFNRRKSSQMILDFMDLARRLHQPFSLAVVEVEDLEKINKEHGLAAGDAVLQRVGHILQGAFRSEDVFARWGGGMFVVGMYGLSRYDGVERLTDLLEKVRREGFKDLEGAEFHVTLGAGVAQYDEDGTDLDSLYKAAHEALARAKPDGGGKVVPAASTQEETDGRLDVALMMRDEAQAVLLSHTLESRGFRARWFQDGNAAHKLLGGQQPALHAKVILLDVDLPGLDGLSLLKRLAWDGTLRESRVIMLTAPTVTNEAQAALEVGACDYLVKPFNLPVAIQRIRQALDSDH